jgi:hypothetical protein
MANCVNWKDNLMAFKSNGVVLEHRNCCVRNTQQPSHLVAQITTDIAACRAVSRQRLGKHVPAATDTHAITEVLLEVVFSIRYVQRGSKEANWNSWNGFAIYTWLSNFRIYIIIWQNYAGKKQKSYKSMKMQMFATLDKANRDTGNKRGLVAVKHTTVQVTRLLL